MASELARRVAGIFVEDAPPPKEPILAWLQYQCRWGEFRPLLDDFCKSEPEPLDPGTVIVENVDRGRILGYVPCVYRDHEAPEPFIGQVPFELTPGMVRRRPVGP